MNPVFSHDAHDFVYQNPHVSISHDPPPKFDLEELSKAEKAKKDQKKQKKPFSKEKSH